MVEPTIDGVSPHVNTLSCNTESEFKQAIQLWIKNNDPKAALTPEEIGALDGFDRVDALRKSAVLQLSLYYRDHPKLDTSPGIIALVHMMADNDRGVCSLSETTMARVLGRSREKVSKAVARLVSEGRLRNLGKPKSATILHPVVPAELACRNHIVWLSLAIAETPTPPKPKNLVTSTSQESSDINVTRDQLVTSTSPDLVTSTSHKFTKISSLKKTSSTASQAQPPQVDLFDEPQPTTPETKNSEPEEPLNSGPSVGESKQKRPSHSVPANASQKQRKPAEIVAEQKATLKALKDAAGEVMKDRVGHFTEVQKWIDDGCDLERDIVPAVMSAGESALRRNGSKSIGTWCYFRNPVHEARDRRLAEPKSRVNGYHREPQQTSISFGLPKGFRIADL
jgi:hypothetical protein